MRTAGVLPWPGQTPAPCQTAVSQPAAAARQGVSYGGALQNAHGPAVGGPLGRWRAARLVREAAVAGFSGEPQAEPDRLRLRGVWRRLRRAGAGSPRAPWGVFVLVLSSAGAPRTVITTWWMGLVA